MSMGVVSFSFKNLIKSIEIIVNEPFITVPSFIINVLANDIFSPVSVMTSFILTIGTCVGELASSGIKNTLPPSVLRYFPLYSLPDTVFRTTIDFSLTVEDAEDDVTELIFIPPAHGTIETINLENKGRNEKQCC